MFRDVTFFEGKYLKTWLTPFTDFFCQFWSARVGFYYHTNEQDVKQNASIIGQLFSKQGSEKIRIDWVEKFQEEQKVKMSPFRYQLAIENLYYIKQRQWSIASLL